jgi:hypothetical protein
MRRALFTGAMSVLLLIPAACGSSTQTTKAASISWVNGTAQAFDGARPSFTAVSVCGSSTDTFLAELLNKSPTAVSVNYEWGDTVPGGKQVLVSGSVADAHLGPGDFPFDHPFGDDLSMDVNLDQPFIPFSRQLGTAHSDVKPNQMHVEISS